MEIIDFTKRFLLSERFFGRLRRISATDRYGVISPLAWDGCPPQLRAGLRFLSHLQSAMRCFVTARASFHELAVWAAQQLETEGFSNLDFRGNVGHSIATHREDRLYIEEGNHRRLSDVSFFTFEPHVRAASEAWGFKHEDIFFFNSEGTVEAL